MSSWCSLPRLLAAAATAWGIFSGSAAGALTFAYDLPATATASQEPPYPSVATLTLSQTADGVQFVLDANEGSPGFRTGSFIQRLDFVYVGPVLASTSFRDDAGVPGAFQLQAHSKPMDAGYQADAFHIVVAFSSKPGQRFEPWDSSTWTILGATLSDFSSFASANAKPGPIFGVISISGYALPCLHPTPSNWVALVPEPGTGLLLALGLGALALGVRHRTP